MTEPFDLDSLDTAAAGRQPFHVTHGGMTYQLTDPRDMPWQDIVTLGTNGPAPDITRLLGAQAASFARHPLPRWKLDRLLTAWHRYYDLGEAVASSTC